MPLTIAFKLSERIIEHADFAEPQVRRFTARVYVCMGSATSALPSRAVRCDRTEPAQAQAGRPHSG